MTDFVMLWNCKYCSTKGNKGYQYDCPNCGKSRPLKVKFYAPSPLIEATAEQMALMGNDPNWYCSFCESGNKDDAKQCWKCSAARDEKSHVHATAEYTADTIPHSEDEVRYQEATPPTPVKFAASDSERSDSDESARSLDLGGIIIIGGVLLVIAAILTFAYLFFIKTEEVSARVTGFSWTQNVALEEYRTLHEENWSIPSGGRETERETRQRGWRTVHDGYRTETYSDTCYTTEYESRTCYRDNGNGSMSSYECGGSHTTSYTCTKTRQVEITHEEPVYDTWYSYDIERWVNIGNYPTSGEDHQPYFDNQSPDGPNQRRIEEYGTYTVFFHSEELGDFHRKYDLKTWSNFHSEQEFVVKVNAFKVILEIKPK